MSTSSCTDAEPRRDQERGQPVGAAVALVPDATIECESCPGWNEPQEPVQLAARTWYVGTAGLSAILIDTGDGLILLDGGLPQSAPLIAENIAALDFALTDIEMIGLSHAHFDHAGGLAALARATGARVVALGPAAAALENGGPFPDDPQYALDFRFPAVTPVEVIEDGWELAQGAMVLTAVATPGHTPGGTSWTWRVCEDSECESVAYVDSLSPVSADGFRFSDGTADVLRQSAERVRGLDCDTFLAPHPGFFGFGADHTLDKTFSCAGYAQSSLEWLDRRLAEETAH